MLTRSLSKLKLVTLLPPSSLFVSFLPFALDIAQPFLDFLHKSLVACVLAQVVAELDCRTAAGRGDFDDDVERDGFFPVGFLVEIVYLLLDL